MRSAYIAATRPSNQIGYTALVLTRRSSCPSVHIIGLTISERHLVCK